MLNIDAGSLEQTAEWLKAMAHPERLRLLGVLRAGEQCVCHLTAVLGQRQPYVSQQLAYLRDAGILADRKAGLRVYYHIADVRVLPLLDALDVHDENELARACDCPRCQEKTEKEALC
jgi:ArsR family transcriptional regulator